VSSYEVTLAGVTVKAGDVGEALEVAADLLEAAGANDILVITCDGQVEDVLTELAREGLRPVRIGHGRNVHLGAAARTS
jgi:hypothetical protein